MNGSLQTVAKIDRKHTSVVQKDKTGDLKVPATVIIDRSQQIFGFFSLAQ